MPIGGEKIVGLHAQVAAIRGDRARLTKGLAVLRRILRAMRWHDQGGYRAWDDGKWSFVSTSLPQTTPEELDALFSLAGIEPDEIVPKGNCFHCEHARDDGTERGYDRPCVSCSRPYLSNFVPASRLTMEARFRRPLDELRHARSEKALAKLRDPNPDTT